MGRHISSPFLPLRIPLPSSFSICGLDYFEETVMFAMLIPGKRAFTTSAEVEEAASAKKAGEKVWILF